jgi:hypothetical protein
MRNELATDDAAMTDEMAVFGTHPYKRSHGLASGLCDTLPWMRERRRSLGGVSSTASVLRARC